MSGLPGELLYQSVSTQSAILAAHGHKRRPVLLRILPVVCPDAFSVLRKSTEVAPGNIMLFHDSLAKSYQ